MTSSDSRYLIEDVLRALQEHGGFSAYSEASVAADRLEDLATRPVTPGLVHEYLRLAALLQPHRQSLAEAEICTRAALTAASGLGEHDLLVTASIVRCRHCVAIGDLPSALECLLVPERGQSASDLAPGLVAKLYHERGSVLFELNGYRDAIRFYEAGIVLDPRPPIDAVVMRAAAVLVRDGAASAAPLLAEAVHAADSHVALIGPRVQARFWSGIAASIALDGAAAFRWAQEIRDLAKGSPFEDRAFCLADTVEGVQIAVTDEPLPGYAKLVAVRQRARSFWPRLREPLLALKLAVGAAPTEWLRNEYLQQLQSDHFDSERYQAMARQGTVFSSGASISAVERTEALLSDRLERQFAGVISSLWESSITAEAREDDSGEHPLRVGRLARLLAEKLGKGAAFCRDIEKAAGWHDIGKIAVPDNIILRPSHLPAHDREAMQEHTVLGAQLLAEQLVDHPAIKMAVSVARSHHEQFSGDGYPDRLAGDQIPEAARITALAESYDAMTHKRAWRPALAVDEALAVIAAERGQQFDPALADAFIQMVRQLTLTHGDTLDEFLAGGSHSSPTLAIRKAILRRTSS